MLLTSKGYANLRLFSSYWKKHILNLSGACTQSAYFDMHEEWNKNSLICFSHGQKGMVCLFYFPGIKQSLLSMTPDFF